ncbi:SMP-30/gluconolactonase/LRE family protein [Bordetella sp. BOR01]|uniref:SMP-30/gluconolactonase/LRE family protein n=1 Tax=Bordetella sp. BOR01 TaxID=2854779 RepID=UPI001C46D5F2|nr:SMP-30/gluconolactonase/LRE family protein [Bordetella sp. BOR01]MBV7483208.1 SMP-30/gluconolactonase/LRE family protein [Bordetella sp. BOR01]
MTSPEQQGWQRLEAALREDVASTSQDGLRFVGHGLQRPECVLTHASGAVYVSDRRGGVLCLRHGGQQQLIGTSNLLPNGISLERDGAFLVANLGPDGGVWRIDAEGRAAPWLLEVDKRPLGGVNFVARDHADRVWICISATDSSDRYPLEDATGYIVLCDAAGARVVAEGLHYTNECRVSADGTHLYVNETFGRRLARFPIGADGGLGAREIVSEFEAGDFPDGLTLDAHGGAWVICVGSNRVYRVGADGERRLVIDDADEATVQQLEKAFIERSLDRPMLSAARGKRLKNITSLAFGGPDLQTAYMGCLAGDALATFRSPVAGLRPPHWDWGRA